MFHIQDPSSDPPNMSDPRAKINYGVPYYTQVEYINDESAVYRLIYLRPNTRPDSEIWEPRVDKCCLYVWLLIFISKSYNACYLRPFAKSSR